MRGTGTEKEVEICATNITNKTTCMSTNAKTETDPVSETSCVIFYRLPYDGKSKKTKQNSNSVCYAPLSESFRIYSNKSCYES
jgi:hypothetical protein